MVGNKTFDARFCLFGCSWVNNTCYSPLNLPIAVCEKYYLHMWYTKLFELKTFWFSWSNWKNRLICIPATCTPRTILLSFYVSFLYLPYQEKRTSD